MVSNLCTASVCPWIYSRKQLCWTCACGQGIIYLNWHATMLRRNTDITYNLWCTVLNWEKNTQLTKKPTKYINKAISRFLDLILMGAAILFSYYSVNISKQGILANETIDFGILSVLSIFCKRRPNCSAKKRKKERKNISCILNLISALSSRKVLFTPPK